MLRYARPSLMVSSEPISMGSPRRLRDRSAPRSPGSLRTLVSSASTSTSSDQTHLDRIRDQFTRQAVPFSTAHAISNEKVINAVISACSPSSSDKMLDVACGGGIVVCGFAPLVSSAEGIDITEAMIERARVLSKEKKLTNTTFRVGNASTLPYPSQSFSLVTTRYTFHHFPDPLSVLKEMKRVCKPGGKICVVDMLASTDPKKAAAFNQLEILRDNSHHRVLSLPELKDLFARADLPPPVLSESSIDDECENLIKRSFPKPEDVDKIRKMFADSVPDDKMGMRTRRGDDGKIYYSTPVAILVSQL